MPLNHAQLDAFFRAQKTLFLNSLRSNQPSLVDQIATTVGSTTTSTDYGWLGDASDLVEWLGPRQIERLTAFSYSLVNKKFEKTVAILRDHLDDDQVGVYSTWSSSAGTAARLWPHKQIMTALNNGGSEVCYDGQFFFDTDHPYVATTKGNIHNAGGANAATPYYLMDTTKSIKPFIWQLRDAPEFTMLTNLTDANVFELDEYRMGVRARGVAGYGLWQTAAKCEGALDATTIEAVVEDMNGLTNDQGHELGINPTKLVVGRSNQFAAKRLMQRELLDAAHSPNVLRNMFEVVVVPELP